MENNNNGKYLLIDRTSVKKFLLDEYKTTKGKHLTENTIKSYLGVMDKILNEPISSFNPIRAKTVSSAVKVFKEYNKIYPNVNNDILINKMEENITL